MKGTPGEYKEVHVAGPSNILEKKFPTIPISFLLLSIAKYTEGATNDRNTL